MAGSQKELMIRIAGKLDGSLSRATTQAQAELSGLGGGISKIGSMITGAMAGVAVGAVVTDVVNTYKDFDQALAQTASTAGATAEEYAVLQNAAMEAGRGTTKTATEAAQALGYLSLAGFSVKDSTAALVPILKLAEATQMDLARCSDLVTDSMSAAGVKIEELPKYLDVLCKANNKSNQTAGQLMEALIGVGGTMKGLGVPIEETSTALGMLANAGIKGSEGGVALNAIMANLSTGTGAAGVAMEKLGINAFDANGKFIGVHATLMKLKQATEGLTEEERNAAYAAIGGKQHVDALNALMNGLTNVTADGVTEWESLHDALLNSSGSLEVMNQQVTATLSGAMSRFGSALDDIKIRAGLAFGPPLAAAIDYVASNVMPLLSAAMDKIPPVLEAIGAGAMAVAGFIGDNWLTFEPIIKGVAAALALWKLPMLIADMAVVISETVALKAAELEYIVVSKAKAVALFLTSSAHRAAMLASMRASLATKAQIVVDNLYVAATSAATVATTVFGGAVAFLTSPIGLAIAAITALVAAGIWLYKNWDMVSQKAAELWSDVSEAFAHGVEYVMGVLAMAQDAIDTVSGSILAGCRAWSSVLLTGWQTWLDAMLASCSEWIIVMLTGWQAWLDVMLAGFYGYVDSMNVAIGFFTDALAGIIDFLTNVFMGNWTEAWTSIVDTFSSIFSGIQAAASAPINAVIAMINRLLGAIASIEFDVPDFVPGLGGKHFSFNVPQIPALAEGGIATAPTLAMIGEGRESEAVLPLSKLKGMMQGGEPAPANITFSPTINIQGNAGVEEVRQATTEAFSQFKTFMARYEREHRRFAFSQ